MGVVAMLSVTVHKDINEYKPKVFMGLSLRMIISIGGAIGAALIIGLYATFVLGVNVDDALMLIYIICVPFWCIGFVRPRGMPFERFFPLWLRHRFGTSRIFYLSSPMKVLAAERAQRNKPNSKKTKDPYVQLRRTGGLERWAPEHG